jgi:hypothetical protein
MANGLGLSVLATPLAMIVVCWMFKKEIRGVLRRATHIKFLGGEIRAEPRQSSREPLQLPKPRDDEATTPNAAT